MSLDSNFIFVGFNILEALFWFLLSVMFFRYYLKSNSLLKSKFLILSITLILFGISDMIELFTGAWYEPLGLMVLKLSCGASMIYCFSVFIVNRKLFDEMGKK